MPVHWEWSLLQSAAIPPARVRTAPADPRPAAGPQRAWQLPRGGPDVGWAAADAGRLVEARGVRLSLEASGVPRSQFAVLRILSTWLLLGFCYLTIVRDGSGGGLDFSLLGFVERAGGGQTFDATVGARALFALVVGALDVFNSLADDLNDPFRGQFTLESTTVSASLQQLRARIRAAVREEVPRPPEA